MTDLSSGSCPVALLAVKTQINRILIYRDDAENAKKTTQ